jgi:hypothetical protein
MVRKVKLELTQEEYRNLCVATDAFSQLAINSNFTQLVRNVFGYSITDAEIANCIVKPILSISGAVPVSNGKISTEKKTTFFVEKYPATTESIVLFNMSPGLTLKYDQFHDTCISDVRAMLLNYKGPHETLRNLCPGSFKEDYGITDVFNMAKDIIHWKPKASK